MASGRVWVPCGVCREYDPLKSVLISWPGEELREVDDPNAALMLAPVDLAALRRQAEGLARFYERQGIRVHMYEPPQLPPPNFLFLRDLFFMTPQGAVLARMASVQRAGEERFAAHALATLGVPILHTVRGEGVFEGADALWLDEKAVLVGLGLRTNQSGFSQVAEVLEEMGVRPIPVALPSGTQHLLGILNFVDRDLAVVRADKLTVELRQTLLGRGIRPLALPPEPETVELFAMNFVTLSPRRIVMPAGCPSTRSALEREGIFCEEAEVGEYVKAAGGLACLTGVLRRG